MYARALRGELSQRAAIKAKCYQCVCWKRFDGGEDRIGRCTVAGCPLHAYRPFRNAQESAQAPEGEGWARRKSQSCRPSPATGQLWARLNGMPGTDGADDDDAPCWRPPACSLPRTLLADLEALPLALDADARAGTARADLHPRT